MYFCVGAVPFAMYPFVVFLILKALVYFPTVRIGSNTTYHAAENQPVSVHVLSHLPTDVAGEHIVIVRKVRPACRAVAMM